MPIHVTTSTTQSLSNKTFVDHLSTTGVAYASGGNSNQWNSAYTTVYANSATWATGSGSGGGGILYYFNQATLAQSPTTNLPLTAHQLGRLGLSAQTTYTSPIISRVDYSLVAGFVTNVLDPHVNAIPGGIWDFNIWGFSNATANNPTVMQALVYTYDGINAPVLLATSDDTTLTDTGIFIQLAMSCLVPQTSISLSARIYVEFRARASANNKTVTLAFGDATPSHIHTTIPAVGGTGLVKVVDGVTQSPASLLIDADVAANANINQSKISGLTAVAFNANSAYSTVNANSATWGTGGGGGGGLTIFSEASSVTSPNNTTPTFGLSARSLSANVDFAVIPKGSGALLAQIPDGSSVGGNKRGLYATDWQRFRAVASQVASSAYATIGGGSSNTASGEYSTIGGGSINRATSDYITIGGGTSNTALSSYATIGGGTGNTASATAATIGGGENNSASLDYATIGGGANNIASGEYATIGGGNNNIASAEYATVGGGFGNTVSGVNSFIAGGFGNTASGVNSFIAGGFGNNTNNQENTFILGSNITAPSANYTYVNNLSSQGDIRASSTIYSASGNSNQWNSTYSTVQSNSASWGGGGGSFTVEDANTIIGLSVFL
jgi:hypothetical protein